MYSEIVLIFCAVVVFEASFGVCLPMDEFNSVPETWENDEDEGYQVILKSPSQVLKVEVVDGNGNSKIQEMELASDEEKYETEEKVGPKSKPFKCNWRRLYKLYLSKRKGTSAKNIAYSKSKRKEIRDAFKVVCENPEDAITYLLGLV